MIWKSVVMLTIFFTPLIILNTGIVSSIPLVFALYVIGGIGMAGIGMGVMHDAVHGSYSKNKKVNRLMGYSMKFR
jgi:linoleoyl-CoA desaturase